MKHLRKFNESYVENTKREIIDNFSYIIDILGDPKIVNKNWGEKHKWTITWELGLDLTIMNEASIVIDKLKKITTEIEDILSAQERLKDYHFQISLSNKLIIEMIPEIKEKDNYDFIIGQKWREIVIDETTIEQFFSSRGIRIIKKWIDDSDYIESSERCASYFRFDKYDSTIFTDFITRFNNEANLKYNDEVIDRDVEAHYQGLNTITFQSYGDKTYISF